jgi:molybdate transport system regulatory protein
MVGPGKAELLDRIAATGSIAAAARDMGMSYKRAWMLIETLNAMFDQPVVVSMRGGPGKGGAVLTERGAAVLAEYRGIEAAAQSQTQDRLDRLCSWLRKRDNGKDAKD